MLPQIRPVLVAITLLLADLGAERDHHHLHDHPRRPGQPDADHADPDLPHRLRAVPVQPGGGALGDVLRRHRSSSSPSTSASSAPRTRGARRMRTELARRRRVDRRSACALLVARLPLPVRVDGALVDQDARRALHRAAGLAARGADARELPEGALRIRTSRATSSTRRSSRSARRRWRSSSRSSRPTASPASTSAARPPTRRSSCSASSCRRRRSSCRSSSRSASSGWSTPISG